ncbi:hypothetical protein QT327_10540 [Olivibacter sp. 47]|uniref:hypothetical protein n=1 Tax=Olivibacter sp. 47 TaxID=3056486 RepID=UPI0025A3D298|nr:hypothetical protein [Olivibacter sp. 47]MDM8174789.1 hypothetical protein [Olivibacter sp. 47]
MTNLFINIYDDVSAARAEELQDCLNLNIGTFDRVFAINNTGRNVTGVENIITDRRPTFRDYFSYINEFTYDEDINVVANSDIYFDRKSISLLGKVQKNQCFALSRYNDDALFMRCDSQDAWVFKGWVKHVANCDFYLGLPGSDNSIAHRLSVSGYSVLNPCFSIRTQHFHGSNVRNYCSYEQTPTPYKNVYPSDLDGCRLFYATSINPYDRLKEQIEAIKTWTKGIVISFNTAKEIRDLAHIEGVTFVELDVEDIAKGKYPRVAAITRWAKYLDFDRFVLINSDIAIEDINCFSKSLLSDRFVMGVRHDNGSNPFPHGYDVFAFTKNHIDRITDTGYALGLPWWDFYVPLAILKSGYDIDVIKEAPVFTHKWHETRYDYSKWNEMGEYFRRCAAFIDHIGSYASIPEMCTATKKFIDQNLRTIA